jgi:hypothetical protein
MMSETATTGLAGAGYSFGEDDPFAEGEERVLRSRRSQHRGSGIGRLRWRSSAWLGWSQVLGVYVASRLFDFLVIGRVARFQAPSAWSAPDPGYSGILALWDGDWYRRIAETGYPDVLPVNAVGQVQQNEWAFYPLFPMTVRVVMRALGTAWPLTASFLAMTFGALAALVMYSLVRRTAGHQPALWTVALFVFFPSAPVLQLAYTEGMGVLFLVTVLWCLQRRWYLVGVPVVLAAGLARPIGVPIAAVVGLHILWRLIRRYREPVSRAGFLRMSAMAAAAAVSGFEWPFLAAWRTGVSDAYTQSMAAWRVGNNIVPLKPWLWNSQYFLGNWVGPITLALVVVLAIWALTRPAARVIAGDLRNWVVCYLGYLAVVLDPGTSLPRYLLLLFPVGTVAVAGSSSLAYRRTLLASFAAGQILWVAWLWRFSPPADWPP